MAPDSQSMHEMEQFVTGIRIRHKLLRIVTP